MHPFKQIVLVLLAAAAMALGLAQTAAAQDFPARAITWIVPYTPGGITDTNSRVFAEAMSKDLGVPVVIENRPGAGGMVGTEYGARAKGDGYTLIYGTQGTMGAAVSLRKKLRYDPLKDFKPVQMMAESPNILVVSAERPYKTVQELVDYARANPRKVKFASAGVGTGTHLTAELFKTITGVDIVHVPYQGSAPALTDLIAGRVDIMFDYLVSSSPHVTSGKLRALAVTAPERISQLPETPTMKELGFPGATTGSWSGIFVPAATPDIVVERLAKAAGAAAKSEQVRNQYQRFGSQQVHQQMAEMRAFVASEIERWREVTKKAGLEPK
jgi:tripartite-type tricarboxylate transporter receptor subunit TctC